MTIRRKWMPSPNFSGRGGAQVRLLVLHTTEGATSIESLGSFFANPSSQVSSHTGADDQPGVIGEYVKPGNEAWTVAAYNPVALSLEFCAFASWSRAEWLQHEQMIRNGAAWVAEEAARHGIPIVALTPAQAQGSGRGVCQHKDLGAGGGGHHDCGAGFPMDKLIEWAKAGGGTPSPAAWREDDCLMQLVFDAGDATHRPECQIAIPNEYSTGQHKLRFTAAGATSVQVNFGDGAADLTFGDFTSQSAPIPQGKRVAQVKLTSGASPVSVCISER